jgi:aspartate/methionine/tyrosine aminotransferase
VSETNKPPFARRMDDIEPFHVMDLLARAKALEAEGRSIIHMEVGEPDFVTPEPVIRAGQQALQQGLTHYTAAPGIPALRQAIAEHYQAHYQVEVAPEQVVVTPGASGALLLIMGVLINPGDEVLMADPGYPCNRHFVRLMEGRAKGIAVDAANRYQLTLAQVRAHWSAHTRAVMLASPSNPTGTVIEADELKAIVEFVRQQQGYVIVDEIYHGLIYEGEVMTAAAMADHVFVINSFSKYFNMTGWRLGWTVAPIAAVRNLDKLAQNIFLAPSTLSQNAALAAFSEETRALLEQRRQAFRQRRDYLLPALREIGFEIPAQPQGAFYLYANCRHFTDDSYRFCYDLLEQAGVAITPGIDFGQHLAGQHVRFAYTTSLENLAEGVKRIARYLK